jgi:hypothetical protein
MKKTSPPTENELFSRVNTRVTREALLRLNQECKARGAADLWGRPCPQGLLLTELIIEHLPPSSPDFADSQQRKTAKRAKRGKPIAMTA